MSVSGIGGGGFFLPTPSVGSGLGSANGAGQSIRDEIRDKGGLVEWAKETKLEALRKKIEDQVLRDQGVDKDSLSAMSAEDRGKLQASIADEVARRMQEAIKDAVEKETREATAKGETPKPMFIDIAV